MRKPQQGRLGSRHIGRIKQASFHNALFTYACGAAPNHPSEILDQANMAIRKYSKYHARSRVQRAFLLWFKEAHKRFKVPFRISVRKDRYLLLETSNHPNLKAEATLARSGLLLTLNWQGERGSELHTNQVCPVRCSGGYICSMHFDPNEWGPDNYVHTERKIYPTREDVWRTHVFEVFLGYVNNTLIKFPLMELYSLPTLSFAAESVVTHGRAVCVQPLMSVEDRIKPDNDYDLVSEEIIPNPMYVA